MTIFDDTTAGRPRPSLSRYRTSAGTDLFVAVLLDRSGSMGVIQDETINAYNAFLTELRADEGTTLVTLTQFDSESIDMLYEARRVTDVPALTRAVYQPRAATPLYDATGTMLGATEQRVNALGWQGSVLCVIITDGLENASVEWTREQVFQRVKALEAGGWAFLYLGAHAEADVQADAMGVAPGNRAQWAKSAGGAREMGRTAARSAKGHRLKERAMHSLILDEERRRMQNPDAE